MLTLPLPTAGIIIAVRQALAFNGKHGAGGDGIDLVEEWDEPDYVSVKCRDPDGYIAEASWEPEQRRS